MMYLATALFAGMPQVATPRDVKDFGLICFCNSRVATPHYPIGLDNNGALLFATRHGATRAQLANAGIAYRESQIVMLKDWGLLSENDKVLTTAFPVLEPETMGRLRDL